MTPAPSLVDAAQGFASDLTTMVRAVITAECGEFRALAIDDRVSIRQHPDTGIALTVRGQQLLTLTAGYEFIWDHERTFLAVHESSIKVYAGGQAQGEPLFRYEYDRDLVNTLPAAHIHLHAHRDAFAYVMTMAGRATKRGKALADSAEQARFPRLAQLHFPVGGDRFRPALEDVLDMLVTEFGVDHGKDWQRAIEQGRQQWRTHQTKAVVRDHPSIAAAELMRLGYTVMPPGDNHPPGLRNALKNVDTRWPRVVGTPPTPRSGTSTSGNGCVSI